MKPNLIEVKLAIKWMAKKYGTNLHNVSERGTLHKATEHNETERKKKTLPNNYANFMLKMLIYSTS